MRLVIADSNIEYATRLSTIISRKNTNKFVINIFSQPEMLRDYLRINTIDILILDMSFNQEDLLLENTKLIIYLVDKRLIDKESLHLTSNYILKYQRVSKIINQIYDYYADLYPTGSHFSYNESSGEPICVYSPNGGAGKTTVAVALAKKYAQLGKKVFYLSLESMPSTSVYFRATKEKGISEIFKSYTEGKEIQFKLEALKIQHPESGVYYFNNPINILDIDAFSQDGLIEIINTITLNSICDYLIIDMPTYINNKALKIFDTVSKIVLINESSLTAKAKWKALESAGFIYEQHKNKMYVVYNKINEFSKHRLIGLPVIAEIPLIHPNNPHDLTSYIASNIPFTLKD